MEKMVTQVKRAYVAPSVQVVQVQVERGFAATAPGFEDGGVW